MIKISFVILFLAPLVMFSQKWETITVDELSEVFTNITATTSSLKNYKVDTYHASYKGHDNTSPYDQSKGYFIRTNKTYKSKMMGVETIQDPDFKVMIYDEEKLMVLASPNELTSNFSVEDYKKNLEFSERIVRRKEGEFTVYKVFIKPEIPLDYYELKIGENNLVYAVVIYYSNEVAWKDDSGTEHKDKPKVEIRFSNYVIPFTPKEPITTAKYVAVTKEKITPLGNYNTYEISDTRYQP